MKSILLVGLMVLNFGPLAKASTEQPVQKLNAKTNQLGGIAGGGGSNIISGFRSTLERHIKTLQDLPSPFRENLAFEPYELQAAMADTLVECAKDKLLREMISKGEKAHVQGNPDDRSVRINLDCTRQREEEWRKLFQSEELGDTRFFIHEGIRALFALGRDPALQKKEDYYKYSGSVLKAIEGFKKEQSEIEFVRRFFQEKLSCTPVFTEIENRQTFSVYSFIYSYKLQLRPVFPRYGRNGQYMDVLPVSIEVDSVEGNKFVVPNEESSIIRYLEEGKDLYMGAQIKLNRKILMEFLKVNECDKSPGL